MAPVSGSPMEMVDQYIKDNKVMMFSKSTCPFCTKIKKLFEQEKIQYEVLELDQIGEMEPFELLFSCPFHHKTG